MRLFFNLFSRIYLYTCLLFHRIPQLPTRRRDVLALGIADGGGEAGFHKFFMPVFDLGVGGAGENEFLFSGVRPTPSPL